MPDAQTQAALEALRQTLSEPRYQAIFDRVIQVRHGPMGRTHPYIVVRQVDDAGGHAVCAQACFRATPRRLTLPWVAGGTVTFAARTLTRGRAGTEFRRVSDIRVHRN